VRATRRILFRGEFKQRQHISKDLKHLFFSNTHTMTMNFKFRQQHCNVLRPKQPYTLAGFEPGIFCSGGGRDDHYATPPGQQI
jgi:hypothetical protein